MNFSDSSVVAGIVEDANHGKRVENGTKGGTTKGAVLQPPEEAMKAARRKAQAQAQARADVQEHLLMQTIRVTNVAAQQKQREKVKEERPQQQREKLQVWSSSELPLQHAQRQPRNGSRRAEMAPWTWESPPAIDYVQVDEKSLVFEIVDEDVHDFLVPPVDIDAMVSEADVHDILQHRPWR